MLKESLLVVFMAVFMCAWFTVNVSAEEDPRDTYFYKSVCPNPAGSTMQVDKWSFYKCECTSYVAHKLNEDGISFNNYYKADKITHHDKKRWSDGGRWKGIAEDIGIETGSIPYPGDVAWWSGHVAYVERVDYDENGQWTKVYISEYNAVPAYGHDYSKRDFTPSTNDKPQAYIHINPIKYRIISDTNGYHSVSIAWMPANVPCNKASVWSYNQTCSRANSHSGICQTAYDELKDIDYWKYIGNDWQTIFFGEISDFQDLCYQH